MSDINATLRTYLLPLVSPVTTATVTVADGSTTTLTLSAEGEILAKDTILVESEEMYITAVTSDASNEATAIRGVNGTSGVAHSASTAYRSLIFSSRFPESYIPNKKSVVFSENSALPHVYIDDLRVPIMQFKCYGATESEAREMAETLRSNLHGITMTTVGSQQIKFAKLTTQSEQIDLDGDANRYPYVLAFYEIGLTNV